MARFIFLRHAKSGTPKVYYGQGDVPLQDEGHEQEREVLDIIERKRETGKIFGHIISSPLSRCRNLAERIAEKTSTPLEIVDQLIEIDIGDWEGKTFEEASNIYHEIAQELLSMSPDLQFPNGESLEGFRQRAAEAWNDVSKRLEHIEEDILVVCHAGIIRALISHIRNLSSEDFWKNDIYNCSATVFEFDGKNTLITHVGTSLENVI